MREDIFVQFFWLRCIKTTVQVFFKKESFFVVKKIIRPDIMPGRIKFLREIKFTFKVK